MICVLHGCSVPVILRPHFKTDAELTDEITCKTIKRIKRLEDAARRIVEFFRKRSAQRMARQDVQMNGATDSHSDASMDASRQEELDKEVRDIANAEKAESLQEIEVAQATPKDHQGRRFYELIGACYVHGMMNGEAIEEQNKLSIKPQVLELHRVLARVTA